jgi:hypothetical protein
MSEPIPVEARFEPDGRLIPLAFEWQGKRHNIESLGRQWQEGKAHHFLVMAPGNQVFELVYLQGESKWQLNRNPSDFKRNFFV